MGISENDTMNSAAASRPAVAPGTAAALSSVPQYNTARYPGGVPTDFLGTSWAWGLPGSVRRFR